MKAILLFSVALLCIVNFADCVASPARTLNKAEKELKTDSDNAIRFHSALYYPREISMQFPGIIVGIEKSPRSIIAKDYNIEKKEIKDVGPGINKDLKRFDSDSKLMYISHIIDNKGKSYGEGNCAIYNAYYRINNNGAPQPISFCSSNQISEINPETAFVSSWDALDSFQEVINNKLKNQAFTHILVVTMGWNTDQEQALRNINSIAASIKNASDDVFNPFVVGVTWPSLWNSPWIGPIYRGSSYPNKANDADEIGLSWLGAILDYGLKDVREETKIVVIGHSFGARASSMAVCVGPAIIKNGISIERKKINKLICLEGAYSIYRHVGKGGKERSYYPSICENVDCIALTSSSEDKAMDFGFFVQACGNDESFKKIKHAQNAKFNFAHAQQDGTISNISNWYKGNILYVNADKLIKYNAYDTAGGAHSDIYRNEIGNMLWEIIKK